MKSTVFLFWSPYCGHCPAAKGGIEAVALERDDFELELIDITSPRGNLKAKEYGITTVPVFLFYGPASKEIVGLKGSQFKEVLHKEIDKSQGKN